MDKLANMHISFKLILASILAGGVAVIQKPEFVALLPAVIQPLWSTFISAALVGGGAYVMQSPIKKDDKPK